MRVNIKLNIKCFALWAFALTFSVAIIWIAFPQLHKWAPKDSAQLASWIQAVGAIAAIFSGFLLILYQENRKLIKENKNSIYLLRKINIELKKSLNLLIINQNEFTTIFFLKTHREILNEYMEISRSISFLDLYPGYPEMLLATRSTLSKVITALDLTVQKYVNSAHPDICVTGEVAKRLNEQLSFAFDIYNSEVRAAEIKAKNSGVIWSIE